MTDVLQHKIMTKKRFNIAVEELVANKNLSYIDAMTHVIETRGMDYSNIKKLLSPSLKAKLQNEASDLKLIKIKSGNKLPI
ncbi:hypothetical protein CBD41_08795 [bacterium TMED181]|nr:MAG: hypothetical protein CBD41_08795 [bacterium TMED181]